MPLVSAWMRPELPPELHVAESHVASFRNYDDGGVVAEVTRREGGSFGCRFQAWVAWRDAADNIRSHGWQEISQTGVVADSLASAQGLADEYARGCGLSPSGSWSDVA